VSVRNDLPRSDEAIEQRPDVLESALSEPDEELVEGEGEVSTQRGLPGERDHRETLGYMVPGEGSGPES
jgi:hypothetical protein